MQISGKRLSNLGYDAQNLIGLYAGLNENAQNLLPSYIIEKLKNFVQLCHEEAIDPAKQEAEIQRSILEIKEAIPGYMDVSLMLYPHEDSKAFQYQAKQRAFLSKLKYLLNNETIKEEYKNETLNILNAHDYSVGTPPVTHRQIDYAYQLYVGTKVSELKKFRDLIGVKGDEEEAQWNYFMNVLDQMVIQSTHYTKPIEKIDFLNRTELTVNFRGLNGLIRTVVGGSAETSIKLLSEEVFSRHNVEIIDFENPDKLFEHIENDFTKVFLIKVKSMRRNFLNHEKWFPYLSRLVFIDNSPEGKSSNTSLAFSFHNGIINILNKVHTKKLGALANSQLNLRLILDKIEKSSLEKFYKLAQEKIKDYENELADLKKYQLQENATNDNELILYKFDDFTKQILKDKYSLTKLADYIQLILSTTDEKKLKEQNIDLIHEFEERIRQYFYGKNKELQFVTINEGGGRNQIKTYGEWLLQRKLKDIDEKIMKQCRVLLDILPSNYHRTLKNHFHKNFGINLFLEKYKEYIIKTENEADNKGRFQNFLIDLGIKDTYDSKTQEEQDIIKGFLSDLANSDKTTISDDVQMIIRDILFHTEKSLRPYILYNKELSWEYQDLFPSDRFDLNPFDLEIGNDKNGRTDYQRLLIKLKRMKTSFQIFDDSGNLWDRFCENLTIVINDPSNPGGFSDFNDENLLEFLKFLSTSKITLFLDEAYNDAVKNTNKEDLKWRTISRYIANNMVSFSKINMVSSLSTTKNLGGTGIRLGALLASPAKSELIEFARKLNPPEKCNTNSVYMLVNTIEAAQLSKKIKDKLESRLAKNASIFNIRRSIEENIKFELSNYIQNQKAKKSARKKITRFSPFEGSPLHIFLLDKLIDLDKLEILNLPDDFLYKGKPFFKYYQNNLVKSLNNFRINKFFREEANKRLKLATEIASKIIEEGDYQNYAKIAPTNGSYLFNIHLKNIPSFQALEKFTKSLAEYRGIAVIPYKIGFVRFSLGDYLYGDSKSYNDFTKDFTNALELFFKYWKIYFEKKNSEKYNGITTDKILGEIFKPKTNKEFIDIVLSDFDKIKKITRIKQESLKISKLDTLYLAYPRYSGVNINTITGSKNSVFEFTENIGQCPDVQSFVRSQAFTKIYEYLLAQVYKNIPLISDWDFESVLANYGKSSILKFITNKLNYLPNYFVLDNTDELIIMKEILIELENVLFSDTKFKIMVVNATNNVNADQQKLEGLNMILKKHIRELLIHFNLPFENRGIEPSISELIKSTIEQFEEITLVSTKDFGLKTYLETFIQSIRNSDEYKELEIGDEILGFLTKTIINKTLNEANSSEQQILNIYLLKRNNLFIQLFLNRIKLINSKLQNIDDNEAKLFINDFIKKIIDYEFEAIINETKRNTHKKVSQSELHEEVRSIGRLFIEIINKTKSTEYYDKYTHSLIRFVEIIYLKQNSGINEMIQHGITVYQNYDVSNHPLMEYNNGQFKWLPQLMSNCGVISAEQPVQLHTRKVTDSKKREYPYHKVDATKEEIQLRENRISEAYSKKEISDKEFIKHLAIKPKSDFFINRLAKFTEHIDTRDYRCKIVNQGIFKELVIFHKAYLKYLSDNYQLLGYDTVSFEEIQNFIPDVIQFLGAPEKVVSFPNIGYFDIPGPNGNIKTIITPLDKKADYFGNVKKPRLTLINEKAKEIGGIPIHGSLFAIEEEDGSIFVVHVDGDSGVGKSEMLAAMMLKWMKKEIKHIRSIKLIAGDMFHIFPDDKGNIYGIGTEIGDFSRVTDFDPEYIKYYNSLFQSSSDSNVSDLNSRSTIGGLCDIQMPFKIDIILTASNFATEEAGIIRFDNPENFLYYRDSHGERKEKATSSDNPHIQRTLMRYPNLPNIVTVLEKHGNYIDECLGWEKDIDGKYYLCSSYKLIEKIDIEELVKDIFIGLHFEKEAIQFTISNINFDIVQNRFLVMANSQEHDIEFLLSRDFFGQMFNALASTPAGQPFISEDKQLEGRKQLLNTLRGNYDEKSKGKIVFGILSTDLGKKGREISGPQKAAEDLQKLIQTIRIENPNIHQQKQNVREKVHQIYSHIFNGHKISPEIDRYNFYLYQLEEMRKAHFVRFDNKQQAVDLSGLKGFHPVSPNHEFSPLLVTPNINIELSSQNEIWKQLLNIPNNKAFAQEFYQDCNKLYIANGYNEETILNNLLLQLLFLNGYILTEDLNSGQITHKVSREVMAAAYSAIKKYYSEINGPKPISKKKEDSEKNNKKGKGKNN